MHDASAWCALVGCGGAQGYGHGYLLKSILWKVVESFYFVGDREVKGSSDEVFEDSN